MFREYFILFGVRIGLQWR